MALRPITVRQYVVQIDGLPNFFLNSLSAPTERRRSETYNDGERGVELRTYDHTQYDEMTGSLLADPAKDRELIQWMDDRMRDSQRFTMTVQPVEDGQDAAPLAGAPTLILNEVQLVGIEHPAPDRSGTGIARYNLTLDYRSYSYQ